MRLEPEEVRAIKTAVETTFGGEAVVRLFGSRVDDTKRGGDIDLHIEASPSPEWFDNLLRLRTLLFLAFESRVDVVLALKGTEERLIDRVARGHGVVL